MSKKLKYNGVEYNSITQLASLHNLTCAIVSSRLNLGWTLDEALGVVERDSTRTNCTAVEYDNKYYDSVADLAEAYNLKPMTLYKRLNRGKSLEEALGSCRKKTKFNGVYKNKEYTSLSSLSRETGVGRKRIKTKLDSGCSLEDAVAKCDNIIYSFPIEIDGTVYTSLKQLAKAYNLKNQTICDRVKRGCKLKDALYPVDTHSGIKTVYNGIEYNSILELAEAFNINDKTLRARLASGKPLDIALSHRHLRKPNFTQQK